MPKARELGLEFVPAPSANDFPSPANIAALCRIVRERSIEIVHGYEWLPALELGFGPHLRFGTPLMTTVMSMSVSAEVPRHAPLIVGTQKLVEMQRQAGGDGSVCSNLRSTPMENRPGSQAARPLVQGSAFLQTTLSCPWYVVWYTTWESCRA